MFLKWAFQSLSVPPLQHPHTDWHQLCKGVVLIGLFLGFAYYSKNLQWSKIKLFPFSILHWDYILQPLEQESPPWTTRSDQKRLPKTTSFLSKCPAIATFGPHSQKTIFYLQYQLILFGALELLVQILLKSKMSCYFGSKLAKLEIVLPRCDTFLRRIKFRYFRIKYSREATDRLFLANDHCTFEN